MKRGEQRGRSSICLFSYPDGHNGWKQACANPKPKYLGHLLSQVHWQESESEVEQPELQLLFSIE